MSHPDNPSAGDAKISFPFAPVVSKDQQAFFISKIIFF